MDDGSVMDGCAEASQDQHKTDASNEEVSSGSREELLSSVDEDKDDMCDGEKAVASPPETPLPVTLNRDDLTTPTPETQQTSVRHGVRASSPLAASFSAAQRGRNHPAVAVNVVTVQGGRKDAQLSLPAALRERERERRSPTGRQEEGALLSPSRRKASTTLSPLGRNFSDGSTPVVRDAPLPPMIFFRPASPLGRRRRSSSPALSHFSRASLRTPTLSIAQSLSPISFTATPTGTPRPSGLFSPTAMGRLMSDETSSICSEGSEWSAYFTNGSFSLASVGERCVQLILCFLTSQRDLSRFARTCRLMYHTVHSLPSVVDDARSAVIDLAADTNQMLDLAHVGIWSRFGIVWKLNRPLTQLHAGIPGPVLSQLRVALPPLPGIFSSISTAHLIRLDNLGRLSQQQQDSSSAITPATSIASEDADWPGITLHEDEHEDEDANRSNDADGRHNGVEGIQVVPRARHSLQNTRLDARDSNDIDDHDDDDDESIDQSSDSQSVLSQFRTHANSGFHGYAQPTAKRRSHITAIGTNGSTSGSAHADSDLSKIVKAFATTGGLGRSPRSSAVRGMQHHHSIHSSNNNNSNNNNSDDGALQVEQFLDRVGCVFSVHFDSSIFPFGFTVEVDASTTTSPQERGVQSLGRNSIRGEAQPGHHNGGSYDDDDNDDDDETDQGQEQAEVHDEGDASDADGDADGNGADAAVPTVIDLALLKNVPCISFNDLCTFDDVRYELRNLNVSGRLLSFSADDGDYITQEHVRLLESVPFVSLSRCENVVDVAPLAHCYSVNLEGCDATDVSPLHNVHTLNLGKNSSLSDISALGHVHTLAIPECPLITNVSALSEVHSLDLMGCEGLTDISVLSHTHTLKLQALDHVVSLSGLRNISDIFIDDCPNVTEVTALVRASTVHLTALPELDDISPLRNAHSVVLEDLPLVTDVSALQDVTDLSLFECDEITTLASLTGVHTLSLKSCHKLQSLAGLSSIDTLTLDRMDGITDLCPVGHVRNLTIHRCPHITDLSPLSSLESLVLTSCNRLTDLSPLSNSPQLRYLYVGYCPAILDYECVEWVDELIVCGSSHTASNTSLVEILGRASFADF